MDALAEEVLDFWLRELTPEDWFRGGEALDARIRERWLPTWERANAGAFREWTVAPKSCLALVLLLDQFPRNIFRGSAKGLTVTQISTFVATIYTCGLVFQYPIGWMSDRMDRRRLILILTAAGAVLTLSGAMVSELFAAILVLGFIIGGVANPLYALIIAYTNDFLGHEDMPAASSGLLFINGLGAMSGPFLIGVLMTRFGPDAYFAYIGGLFALIAAYAGYRMTRRSAPPACPRGRGSRWCRR